jgi:hypothetical protein
MKVCLASPSAQHGVMDDVWRLFWQHGQIRLSSIARCKGICMASMYTCQTWTKLEVLGFGIGHRGDGVVSLQSEALLRLSLDSMGNYTLS